MSITICWRPVDKRSNSFGNGTSTSYERLISVFGSKISETDLPRLHAMAVAADSDFYREVAETVEKVGDIEVWGEY